MCCCSYVSVYNAISQRKGSAGRIKNDLYCGFTEWLRDLAVNLENKPLLSAVEDTYDSCPVIMKESLGKFIYEIELNPSDMPYYSFLNEFDDGYPIGSQNVVFNRRSRQGQHESDD